MFPLNPVRYGLGFPASWRGVTGNPRGQNIAIVYGIELLYR